MLYVCVLGRTWTRSPQKGLNRQKFFRKYSKKEMFFNQVLPEMKEDFAIVFVEGLGCGVLRRDLR